MSNSLHVVIITPVFAVDESDSINVPFLQIYCKELLKTNTKLTIIAEQYPQRGNYSWHGVPVITLKRKTSKAVYKFLRRKRLLNALKTVDKKSPVHVIHNIWFNILGQISEKYALQHRIKHVTSLAGQDVLPSNDYLKQIPGYTGELVCPSLFQKLKLQEHYAINPKIVGWGINDFTLERRERTIDLILCGWVNPVKNYPEFLKIVSELHKTNSLKKVVVCGGGPLLNSLIRDVQARGLNTLIDIKSSIPRDQVLALMQQSKILVHTSDFESFGLVLAEALAANCVVLSKPVGIAFDQRAIITCHTTEEFVSGIKNVLQNYRDVDAAYLNRYPIRKTVEDYLEIYQNRRATTRQPH